MPTRQGWIVAAASMGVVGLGRLFGIFELYLVGAAGAVLVIVAAAVVGLSRLHLDVARHVHPARVHAGQHCRVDLRARNRGRRRSPVLTLRDPVGGGRRASVVLAPLGPGEAAGSSYNLPTERRGILSVGPLEVALSDPFGLAAATTPAAPRVEVTVWPAVEDVLPLPHTLGDDPHAGTDHPNALSSTGEDFYALRPYVTGDDLRRVHWPSTARRDDLTVRQDEMPWQGRVTILLDTRAAAHSEQSFERAVSAAASVVVSCAQHRFLLRLVTTAGADTGFAAGSAHVAAIMERLAVVGLEEPGRMTAALSREPSVTRSLLTSLEESSRLTGVLAALRRPGSGGALAALVGGREPADLAGFARLRTGYASVTVVAFLPAAPDRSPPAIPPGVAVVDHATDFPTAWNRAVGRRGRAAAGTRL